MTGGGFPRTVTGGKPLYGAAVGILMLEARFPRIPGDMGNARTWDFPVLYKIVKGASPERVVLRQAEGTLDAFIEAARELVSLGARGITTNCGFLSLFQEELAAASGVPVLASSLAQTAMVNALLPKGKRAGILTISAKSLTPRHLKAAGVPEGTPVRGMDESKAFAPAILGDALELDVGRSRGELVEEAEALAADNPDVGAIVLECTNMSPYSPAIRRATGLPVFDMANFVRWFQGGLQPNAFLGDPDWD